MTPQQEDAHDDEYGYDRDHLGLDDLEMDVGAACAAFDGEIVLKLPRSFDVDELPEGRWELEAMVDERGILKMLVARRPPIS